MKFTPDEGFRDRNKENFLFLIISDLNENLRKRGKDLADEIVGYTKEHNAYMTDICIDNFLRSAVYIITEMLYVKDWMFEQGLKLDMDIPAELIKLWEEDDELTAFIKHFMPSDFYYEESRYWTPEEIHERNERVRPIMQKLWDEINQKTK